MEGQEADNQGTLDLHHICACITDRRTDTYDFVPWHWDAPNQQALQTHRNDGPPPGSSLPRVRGHCWLSKASTVQWTGALDRKLPS